MMALRLTESLRAELKKPLGRFVTDISTLKNRVVVSVGDQASRDALAFGLRPKLCVYDGRIGRREVGIPREITGYPVEELTVKNEAGTLSNEVFRAVERVFGSKSSFKIRVEGEEDLVTLAAVKYAPYGSVVLYGQPGEGLVGVDVDEASKQKIGSLLGEMVENGN
jgi:hypothetical protein